MSLLPIDWGKTRGMPQQPTQQGVDRRKQMAEALMRVGQQGTGLSGPWGAIASALAGGVAGWQQRKAGNEQTAVNDAWSAKFTDALLKGGSDPAAIEQAKLLPIDQQRTLLGQMTATRLAPKIPQNLEKIDTGDAIELRNPATGAVVQRIPKGVDPALKKTELKDAGGSLVPFDPYAPIQAPVAKTVTPDAQLSSDTTKLGYKNSAEIAAANRGTTERGQDIGAQTAAAGRSTTERGQDLTAESARLVAGNKPLSEYESKAVGQLTRMQGAEQKLQQLQSQGFSPGYLNKLAEKSPIMSNALQSPEFQQYKQAANEFIAGILRLDSGAAVPEVEFERYFQTYFAQPGDGDDVIAQKADARNRAMEALRAGMGSKASRLVPQPGDSGQPVPPAKLASNSGAPPVPQVEAPAAAVEALKANPKLAEQFKAKFGYLPPGF